MIEHLSFERAVDEYVGMCRVRDGHNFIPRKRAELLFMALRCAYFYFYKNLLNNPTDSQLLLLNPVLLLVSLPVL